MNVVDWIVLLGTLVGIAAYGTWRTRHVRSLNTYLRGSASTGWVTIGLASWPRRPARSPFSRCPARAYENGHAASCKTISVCRWR